MDQLNQGSQRIPRLRLSTHGIAPADRADFVRESSAEIAFPLTMGTPIGDGPVSGQMLVRPFGGMALVDIRFNNQIGERTNSDIASKAGNCLFILRQGKGRSVFESRRGRNSTELKSGDMLVVDADEPFVSACTTGCDIRTWVFPRPMLSEGPSPIDLAGGAVRLGDDGAARLVKTYVNELAGQIDQLSPSAAEGFAGQAAQLLSMALAAGSGDSGADCSARNSVQLLRVRNAIAARLTDPLLSVARIAADCGVSPRTVHYLFEGSGRSFARYVLDRRLALTHDLLGDPAFVFRSVADVAFAAGFNSISTFYLHYSERFGETPRRTRERRLISAA